MNSEIAVTVIPVVTVNAEMGICSHIETFSKKIKKRKKRKINFGLENLVKYTS